MDPGRLLCRPPTSLCVLAGRLCFILNQSSFSAESVCAWWPPVLYLQPVLLFSRVCVCLVDTSPPFQQSLCVLGGRLCFIPTSPPFQQSLCVLGGRLCFIPTSPPFQQSLCVLGGHLCFIPTSPPFQQSLSVLGGHLCFIPNQSSF